MAALRLQKFLAQTGISSRRRAEELILSGAVSVNGAVVNTFGVRVDPERDRVEVEGRRVKIEPAQYRLLLKPRACLSTLIRPTGQDAGRATLAKYVPTSEVGWQVVAPLDFPSEGVILLTTDGELAGALSRGGGRAQMTYHIKYQGTVGDQEIGTLLRGWTWENRTIKPTSASALATTGKNTWVELVVADTRPRVLKASGNPIRRSVLKISRVRLGPLSFEGLAMGEMRELAKGEIVALRRAAGLEGNVPLASPLDTDEDGDEEKPASKPRRPAKPAGRPTGVSAGKPDRRGAGDRGGRAFGEHAARPAGRPSGDRPVRRDDSASARAGGPRRAGGPPRSGRGPARDAGDSARSPDGGRPTRDARGPFRRDDASTGARGFAQDRGKNRPPRAGGGPSSRGQTPRTPRGKRTP